MFLRLRRSAITKLNITLVHGTFARQAAWTEKGSKLRNYLQQHLKQPVSFAAHGWTGWNTYTARFTSATELSKYLQDHTSQDPDCRQYIIGHSHGGNVALDAIGRRGAPLISGVICLNTPFFAVFKENMTQLLLAFSPAAAFLTPLVAGTLWLVGPLEAATSNLPKRLSFLIAIPLVVFLFFVITFCALAGWFLAARISRWLAEKSQEFSATFALPSNKHVPVFCLWAAGDEVMSWFQLFDTIAGLPRLFLSPVMLIIFLITFMTIQLKEVIPVILPGFGEVISDPNLHVYETSAGETARRDLLGLLLLSGFSYTTIVVAICIFLKSLLSLPFHVIGIGIPVRKLAQGILVRIAFTPVPISSHRIEFCELESRSGLLSHSKAYSDTDALQKIVEWINAQEANT